MATSAQSDQWPLLWLTAMCLCVCTTTISSSSRFKVSAGWWLLTRPAQRWKLVQNLLHHQAASVMGPPNLVSHFTALRDAGAHVNSVSQPYKFAY